MTFRTSVCILLTIGCCRSAASQTIDAILVRHHAAANMEPGALCDDATFLRRITLDLAGRIPTVDEFAAFLANPNRAATIDHLLAQDEFPQFWGEMFTSLLLGPAIEEAEVARSRSSFKKWFSAAIAQDRGFDDIAFELLSSAGSIGERPAIAFLARRRDDPIVAVSRVFLGVRLDCARCHDHPYARWTEQDYQAMNRFFDLLEFEELPGGRFRLSDRPADPHEQPPQFLTGAQPQTSGWRAELALYATSCKPFARTFANRIWYLLMGRGVVDPPDDFNDSNPPSCPELIEHLTAEAVNCNFSIRTLVRYMCLSAAYQRESRRHGTELAAAEHFTRRILKPLTPRQWIRSLVTATGRTLEEEQQHRLIESMESQAADAALVETWHYAESVQQLMLQLALDVHGSKDSLDELYARFLTRRPTAAERELCTGRSNRDIAFALLHGSEFRFNH